MYILHNTTQHSTTQYNTTQHNTTQHSTTQHSTTRHNTAQHGTVQHSTAQHNNNLFGGEAKCTVHKQFFIKLLEDFMSEITFLAQFSLHCTESGSANKTHIILIVNPWPK